MNTLSFHDLPSGKFESDVFQFGDDAALELNFESVPKFVGVDIAICQSLSQENWQTCYYEQQVMGEFGYKFQSRRRNSMYFVEG